MRGMGEQTVSNSDRRNNASNILEYWKFGNVIALLELNRWVKRTITRNVARKNKAGLSKCWTNGWIDSKGLVTGRFSLWQQTSSGCDMPRSLCPLLPFDLRPGHSVFRVYRWKVQVFQVCNISYMPDLDNPYNYGEVAMRPCTTTCERMLTIAALSGLHVVRTSSFK